MSQKIKTKKFFICILICLLITSINSIVFAESSMTLNEFEQIYFAYNGKELTTGQKNKIENLIETYDYITVNTTNTGSEIAIRASDEVPTVTAYSSSLNRYSIRTGSPQGEIYTIFKNGTTQTQKGAAVIAVPITIKDSTHQDAFQNFTYLPDGANNTIDNFNFYPGWMNVNIEIKYYLEPYFEWSGQKVATTTLENFDGDIPCFYPNSFKNYANSYMSYKEIGKLYVDENYTLNKIYYGYTDFTIYNMEQTKSWTYRNDAIFINPDEYKNGYAIYDISIELKYINTPYIYTMDFISRDIELGEDISVDFILLTDPNQETTGPIITPSGDILPNPGGTTGGGTTTGDIENTLNEIFKNPDQEQSNQNAEDSINQIKENITEKLEENEIIGALDLAEQGFIDILKGEAGDFKISWNGVKYKGVDLIPKGEVNFSKIARENESVGYVKTTLNTILSAFMAFNILKTLYNLLMEMLGVSSPIINEVTTNDLNLNKKGGKAQ